MKSRTTPYQIEPVPKFPEALQIYRIPASSYWQCRYFVDGKYIRRSTGTTAKADAITFAKQIFYSVRLAEKLDQQKHPYTFAAIARKFLKHQASLVIVGDLGQRCQYEDKKKLSKDILPYFGTLDISQITKITINEYLATLADRKLSKSTRNKHVGVIRKILKNASDAGILKALPAFPTIGTESNPRGYFDRNEFRKLRLTAQSYAKLSYVGHAYVKGSNIDTMALYGEVLDKIIRITVELVN
jgi:hypothetical protein